MGRSDLQRSRYPLQQTPTPTQTKARPTRPSRLPTKSGRQRPWPPPRHSSSRRAKTWQDGEPESILSLAGLAFSEVGSRAVRLWVLLQALGLAFQWALWAEVRGHLDLYEQTLGAQCSPEHAPDSVCPGPLWNISARQDFVLEGQGLWPRDCLHHSRRGYLRGKSHTQFAPGIGCGGTPAQSANSSHSIDFVTRSRPPTFLVTVSPVSRAQKQGEEPPLEPPASPEQELNLEESSNWDLQVMRLDPPAQSTAGSLPLGLPLHWSKAGTEAVTVEDLSWEVDDFLKSGSVVQWRATVTSRFHSTRQTRFMFIAEDAAADRPKGLQPGSSCSFPGAWRAFHREHQGRSHDVLSLCRAWLGFCVPAGLVAIALVMVFAPDGRAAYCSDGGSAEDDCGAFGGFHFIVLAKFFIVDMPQQACIVLYLLGWYDEDGLLCQLCLFHPSRCSGTKEPWPMGVAGTGALLSVLLSSLANQLLVAPASPAVKKGRLADSASAEIRSKEDAACTWRFARSAAACLATLPFTTGVLWATQAILPLPNVLQALVLLPCLLGWLTVAGLALRMAYLCCQDCSD
ncbi:unnamed protein product [Polarella glacialis]|uniref:Uncharacterized protein n=1 Tax=Polarella glacialis TaxID=89957 RepID=A0A813K9Q9_POLGL|nr:unnamed protein product [Polarella glacialis]CAE8693557.1 unnamed protein product [Polarella glacialis]